MTIKVDLGTPLLARNEEMAEEIRYLAAENQIFIVNIMSSPGAGKTTLLEQALGYLTKELRTAVIEGDIATTRDADRISAHGVEAVQLNTEGACHLDARMVYRAMQKLDLTQVDLLLIENIGNLVCPAEFNLGEDLRLVLLSTTEGNDKVVKYPVMFRDAQMLVINKVDLLPYTDFSREELAGDVAGLNPALEIFYTSARSGEGVENWVKRLVGLVRAKYGVSS
ncbi:hydrogenase accessory protein HypB [Acididesulfobacillus acetoxydans]|uniref:Hydrogenase accessory protein HypB n=1 Tax=Acididesulfobacillus acetoxydans TaxID=1561005 RepID=A0A8S0XXC8_9FIRM|nr:hydrogenase nickel incorporation protein HypB [Acididesulfobacillus acetoxydans]CAA7601647.1 hydrogenase accessory protein HypB [Acididesulfobacillus acetoxydans]CEJ07134.1 Hydrogenase nickel incorporation protein HypB [Acididesulfobacillus acetoxydans]